MQVPGMQLQTVMLTLAVIKSLVAKHNPLHPFSRDGEDAVWLPLKVCMDVSKAVKQLGMRN